MRKTLSTPKMTLRVVYNNNSSEEVTDICDIIRPRFNEIVKKLLNNYWDLKEVTLLDNAKRPLKTFKQYY